jgi:Right handed beta helix region
VSNQRDSLVRTLGALAVAVLVASPAAAQTTRTWVEGENGDDAFPCSRTAPCKTFAGAISKTASGGEIDAIDAGSYGSVTITKPITIDGGANFAGILASSGAEGIIISAGNSAVVTLRNLNINGAGTQRGLNGIHINTAGEVNIEHCAIYGFSNDGIDFEPTADEIKVTVTDSTISRNTANGIFTRTPGGFFARLTLTNVRLERNGVGLTVADNALVFVADSIASNNTSDGFAAVPSANGPAEITLESVRSANNGNAGVVSQGSTALVRLSNSAIDHNLGAGVAALSAGQILSNGNNRSTGNAGGDGAVTGVLVTVM